MDLLAWFRKYVLRKTKDGRHRVVGSGISTMQFIAGPKPVGRAEVASYPNGRAEKKLVATREDYVLPSTAVAKAEVDAAETELIRASQPSPHEDYTSEHELSLSEDSSLID